MPRKSVNRRQGEGMYFLGSWKWMVCLDEATVAEWFSYRFLCGHFIESA
ncbi:hypothetical protein [Neisseria wadsworthii]|nr:hypothetical protein [Neisseria wadsworthii]QMT34648.1 hypothetical protein H3L96_05990 [Neisseria wadsworthii]